MRPIHVVGSIPLRDADEVFRTVAGVLGDSIHRIPDGETGYARSVWIQCQVPYFLGNPAFEMVEPDPGQPGAYRPARIPAAGIYSHSSVTRYHGQARLRPGLTARDVHFDNIGYADWATESYATFKHLKDEGLIAPSTRFQVSLPIPRHGLRVVPEAVNEVLPAYDAAMFQEVARMAGTIPPDELAIQWDSTSPGQYETADAATRHQIIDGVVRASNAVPLGVEMGIHWCYGDFEHRHQRDPEDTGAMTEMTNAVVPSLTRRLDWVHMPVVRSRSDTPYFAPLRDLKLPPETTFFLGLVHYTDGVEGTRKRMEAASRVVPDFGIATECGFGRRPPETIPDLLRIHGEAASS